MKIPYLLTFLAITVCAAVSATEAHVHVFSSGENGIFANAYLVETEHSVVAIDATLLESTSKALRAKLVSLGKPLKAVLITHGHPDHYNGITNLVAGEAVDIVATAGTDRVIREADSAKEKLWAPVFGAEWPMKRTFPNRIIPDGDSLEIDGVKFTVHDLGHGESHSDSYWLMESGGHKVAFIGDVVLNRVHAYVTDGHTTAWLKNIDRLEKELRGTERLYPGHGESGGLELLGWERGYLTEYRTTVQALAQGKPTLTDEQKKGLTTHMTAFLPNQKLAFLIPLGADPVAAELSAKP
jgi:glyoxylase-like metal-dependent hydrolase (beta-lactamase superfamily II)